MSARSRRRTGGSTHLVDADFVLDTLSLGRRPGSMRTVTRTASATSRIGLDLIAIPEGAQVDLDLRLESVSEGVLVTGQVAAPIEGECVRCLEPFEDSITLSVTELFAYPDSRTEQTTEEDEIRRVVDEHIDLEPVIVDTVGMTLPLQPLCMPDCLGLCSECGIRLAIAGSDHGHEILDPRWAGLAAKFGSGSASTEPETRAEDARLDPIAEEK